MGLKDHFHGHLSFLWVLPACLSIITDPADQFIETHVFLSKILFYRYFYSIALEFQKKEGTFMFRWFYKLIEFCQISYLTQFVATILEYWQTLGNLILSCQDLHFLLANIKRYIKTLLFADLISSFFFIGNKVIVIEGNWPMVIQRVCSKLQNFTCQLTCTNCPHIRTEGDSG